MGKKNPQRNSEKTKREGEFVILHAEKMAERKWGRKLVSTQLPRNL